MSDHDFYRAVLKWQTGTVTIKSRERAIRLYCTNSGQAWLLQVRTPVSRADGSEGKAAIAAGATLLRDDMIALRDAITALLIDADIPRACCGEFETGSGMHTDECEAGLLCSGCGSTADTCVCTRFVPRPDGAKATT